MKNFAFDEETAVGLINIYNQCFTNIPTLNEFNKCFYYKYLRESSNSDDTLF